MFNRKLPFFMSLKSEKEWTLPFKLISSMASAKKDVNISAIALKLANREFYSMEKCYTCLHSLLTEREA